MQMDVGSATFHTLGQHLVKGHAHSLLKNSPLGEVWAGAVLCRGLPSQTTRLGQRGFFVKELTGIWRLLRFKDYAGSVVFTTCLGVAAAGGSFGWKMALVLLANWLVVGFAFMYNDVEDAPDDARDPEKVQRNPVTAGLISAPAANLASFAVAIVGFLLFLPLGSTVATVLAGITVLLGFLYSYRPLRFKGIAVVDVVSHALMLSSFQLLCGYFVFADTLNTAYIAPLISMTAASAYGQLYNQVRDFEGDQMAGLKNTAGLVGKPIAVLMLQSLLWISILAGVYALAIQQIAPFWVFAFGFSLLLLVVIPGVVQGIRSGQFHQVHLPVINFLPYVGTAMMAAWFIVPWLFPGFAR
jgi:4-hydroxybenzoate polyprenyltransferase